VARLCLIRHARTVPRGAHSPEWPLSPEGERQADSLADAPFWSEVAALLSSPEPKALQTVRPAAERHGLPIRQDAHLREARRPPVWVEDYDAAVRAYLEGPAAPEGWEPPSEAVARVASALEELSELHTGESVAVAGHGLTLALHVATLPGTGAPRFELWLSIGFCTVAVVEAGRLAQAFTDPRRVPVGGPA
jgi:broad specificity phosphatase PhoE